MTVVAASVALLTPATGYELSVYASTPVAVWILIALSSAISVAMLVKAARTPSADNRWMIALGVLVANGALVLLISVLRDYYAVGGDSLMHIGYVLDMTGNLEWSDSNMYPAMHLPSVILSFLGVSPALSVGVAPALWYIFYVVTFYFLARFLWEDHQDKGMVIVAVTLAAFLFVPVTAGLTGTTVALAFFPLTLLTVLRLRREFAARNVIDFLIVFIVSALLHPQAIEMLMLSMGVSCFGGRNWVKMVVVTVLATAATVWWVGYWFNLDVLGLVMNGTMNGTGSGVVPDGLQYVGLPFQGITLEGVEATRTIGGSDGMALLIQRFGVEIVLGAFAVLCLPTKRVNVIATLFVVVNVLWVGGWILNGATYGGFLVRLMYWAPMLSILVATPYIHSLLPRWRGIIMTAILIVMAVYPIFRVYQSPMTGLDSRQISHQEVKGATWIIENGDPDIYIDHLNSQRISRYMAAIYGANKAHWNRSQYWLAKYEPAVRGFLSYQDFESIGEAYDDDVYLVVTKHDRLLPRWDADQLHRIETDQAAKLMYADGDEYQVWYIEGRKVN